MRKVLACVAVLLFACAVVVMAEEAAKAKGAECFVCAKCAKVAVKATKCCEQDMAAMKVLEVKEGKATVCACAAGCAKCKGIDPAVGTKCECGKDVRMVDLTGKFVCADGKCLAIGDAAGKCGCGKDMVQVK